jgi:penicillin-binding protein 1A
MRLWASRPIVAGCYIGYDQPESMGRGASAAAVLRAACLQRFMLEATREYGGDSRCPKAA